MELKTSKKHTQFFIRLQPTTANFLVVKYRNISSTCWETGNVLKRAKNSITKLFMKDSVLSVDVITSNLM